MRNDDFYRLADLIKQHSEELLSSWHLQVRRLPSAQNLDVPTLNNHISDVLSELTDALAARQAESVIDLQLQNSPTLHGTERFRAGFDIVEVVAEYSIIQEIVQTLAEDNNIDISVNASRVINRVFARAIAVAVDTFARQKTLELQQRREEHMSFVMHDLKTPLAAMQSARIILDRSLPAETKTGRVRNMLEIMGRNASRLSALLKNASWDQQNIVASTGDIRIERREFDLWPLIEDLLRDLGPLTESSSVHIVNAIPDDFVIFADAALLTQVFQNLLSNAIRYTKQGQITIDAEVIDEGQSVRCCVRDTGAGIEPERLDRVFDKLETDPNQKGGMGLGLAIVKQIVEGHGGQVFVESGLAEGSTFSFTLPGAARG